MSQNSFLHLWTLFLHIVATDDIVLPPGPDDEYDDEYEDEYEDEEESFT